jgi:hypothetical protein
MSVSVAAVGTVSVSPTVPGTRRSRQCKVTFDTNYPSGGYALTASTFGLTQLDTVSVAGTTVLGRLAAWDQANSKLIVFKAVLTENDVADIHTDSVIVTAVGL